MEVYNLEAEKRVHPYQYYGKVFEEEHGNARTANTALLGALTELTDVLKRESYENAIREMFASKPKVIDVNIEVLEAGAEWIKNNS